MGGWSGLLAALRQVLVPVNVVLGLLFAVGVALLAVGMLQLLWRDEEPLPEPQEDGGRTY